MIGTTWTETALDALLHCYGRSDEALGRELGHTASAIRFMRLAIHGYHQGHGNHHAVLLDAPLREHLAAQHGQGRCPYCGANY
jgi:hypothetical protein